MRPPLVALIALSLSMLAADRAAASSSGEKVPYRIPRSASAIRIDGSLDDPLWKEALKLNISFEVEPGENIAAPVETEVFLAHDETRIYVAFKARDPDPSKIRARLSDRDDVFEDDWIGVFFDTFNDGRRDFGFVCNPLGVQLDMIEAQDMEGGEAWDAIWDSAGRIGAEGYAVEMAIPFSCMGFQRSESDQVWGLDAVRSYPRSVRHHLGLFARDRNNNCYMCQAEKIVGFAGVRPGKNLELDPTLSGIVSQERRPFPAGPFEERERTLDPGVTARWSFTPSMTLSAAANPDFSQVEADAVQLDINEQFALFYEEKRPFFLEGMDFFSTRMQILHTRTLADPNWGIKLTGKEGANAIGLFSVQDDVTNLILPSARESEETSLDVRSVGSVLRYRRDLWNSSVVGLMLTDREGEGYHNRLASIDGVLRVTKTDAVRIQGIGTDTRYPAATAGEFGQRTGSFRGEALDFYYIHSTKSLDYYVGYRDIAPGFRADFGYMPQVGFRFGQAGWGYTWRRGPGSWWTLLNVGAGYEYSEDSDGVLLARHPLVWFDYTGPRQSEVDLSFLQGDEGFAGREFSVWHGEGHAEFWPTGSLLLELNASGGRDIDYENARPATSTITLEPEISYRIGRHLSLGAMHTYERTSVAEGRLYSAHATWLKTVCQLNRRTFVRAIVQHVDYLRNSSLYGYPAETRTKRLLSQLLFSYKMNPQTVFFLGYSDNYAGGTPFDLTQIDRTFFAKVGYAWTM